MKDSFSRSKHIRNYLAAGLHPRPNMEAHSIPRPSG